MRRRPHKHQRLVRTKYGRRKVVVNPHISKRPFIKGSAERRINRDNKMDIIPHNLLFQKKKHFLVYDYEKGLPINISKMIKMYPNIIPIAKKSGISNIYLSPSLVESKNVSKENIERTASLINGKVIALAIGKNKGFTPKRLAHNLYHELRHKQQQSLPVDIFLKNIPPNKSKSFIINSLFENLEQDAEKYAFNKIKTHK